MDVYQLKTSFELISDRRQFAQRFYEILFEKFPDTHALFQKTDWEGQYRSLMATLAAVVSGVERGDNLVPALHNLGAKHHRYGAKPEHYPAVGASLIATFQDQLGTNFTPAMLEAWKSAFEVISTEMLQGATQVS